MVRSDVSAISKTLNRLGLDPAVEPLLLRFIALFAKWNDKINLSAAKNPVEIEEHVRDSLHVVPHLRGAARVLDVGSGGGFPVAIAAACLPATSFVALEPVHKKHAFLRTAARELALANLAAFALRVEDHEPSDYDVAMSRATLDLPAWLALGASKIRPGGTVLGFEATPRPDAPGARHAYTLDGKARAIVAFSPPAP